MNERTTAILVIVLLVVSVLHLGYTIFGTKKTVTVAGKEKQKISLSLPTV